MAGRLSEQMLPQEYFGVGQWMVREERMNPQLTTFILGLGMGLLIGALIMWSRKQ